MGLISLKCPNCGGDIQLNDDRELGFCMYCGQKVMVEEKIKQTTVVDHSAEINNLIMLADISIKVNNYEECLVYSQKILSFDAENQYGWYYKGRSTAVRNGGFDESLIYFENFVIFAKENDCDYALDMMKTIDYALMNNDNGDYVSSKAKRMHLYNMAVEKFDLSPSGNTGNFSSNGNVARNGGDGFSDGAILTTIICANDKSDIILKKIDRFYKELESQLMICYSPIKMIDLANKAVEYKPNAEKCLSTSLIREHIVSSKSTTSLLYSEYEFYYKLLSSKKIKRCNVEHTYEYWKQNADDFEEMIKILIENKNSYMASYGNYKKSKEMSKTLDEFFDKYCIM